MAADQESPEAAPDAASQAQAAQDATQPGTLLNNPLVNQGRAVINQNLSSEGQTQLKMAAGAGAMLMGGGLGMIAGGYLLGDALKDEEERVQRAIAASPDPVAAGLRHKIIKAQVALGIFAFALAATFGMSFLPVEPGPAQVLVNKAVSLAMLLASTGFLLSVLMWTVAMSQMSAHVRSKAS